MSKQREMVSPHTENVDLYHLYTMCSEEHINIGLLFIKEKKSFQPYNVLGSGTGKIHMMKTWHFRNHDVITETWYRSEE